jgi:hypothetical protein
MEFEHIIQSATPLGEVPCRNLAELIFNKLDHRDENSEIILSHDGNQCLRIHLAEYRSILIQLYNSFRKKDFKPGDTVLLASVSGNIECYVAILFSALSSFGIRVLLPMFMESSELDKWLSITHCCCIICPAMEISALNHHEKEKAMIEDIRRSAENHDLHLFDNLIDFNLPELIRHPFRETIKSQSEILK